MRTIRGGASARAPLMRTRPALITALTLLVATVANAQAPDVRAIQAREAQKTDERTLAYFARFKAALVDRFGGDPLLTMLVFSENEGSALVHTNAVAPAQHVIFQEGKWIGTDGRQLKPWVPGADPEVARFRLSRITEAFVRERFRAHRAQPDRASDHLSPVQVGYFGKPFDRLVLEMQVLSLSRYGLSSRVFDLASGAALDVDKAIADARTQRAEAERKTAAEANAVAQRNRVKGSEPADPSQGRQTGISEDCAPDKAFRDGLAAREYRGGCDTTFARNHDAAYKVAELRKELEANRSAISWREAEIRHGRASDDRKNNLRNEVRDLDRRRQTLRSQLDHAEQVLQHLRAPLGVK